jgi:phage FluMu protein Com/Zn ribbon nucleic-acid-binding protein
MPVKVRCSSCDKVLTVPDTARGKAVKCPQCDTRIPVPTGDSQVSKVASSKPKKKPAGAKSAKPMDSEDALATLDLRRVEDTNARICSKCGFDMYEVDEEETECPKCGFDIEAGGMGAKARKRALKGPDPADFYPGLAKNAVKFLGKNQMLAWRTVGYTLVCLLISLLCAFMYLWISAWPPRAFFALCFTVSFLVIPGWLWYLDTEVIKLTLERKDKFKKLNFDFFLASAKGIMAVVWAVIVAGPILLIPAGIGYYLVNYSGQPEWVMGLMLGIGMIPVLWVLPVTMSHMTMPISGPGWMFWKVIQFWARTIGGSTVWLIWLLITSIPLIAGAATIGAVWGNDINSIVQTMESNADINRRLLEAENTPKGKDAQPIDITAIGKPADVDFKPLIGPAIILIVMCLPLGFIAMFNMRTNGQFTFYFRERLELIDKAKEYKYIAKKKRDEDEDDAPPTIQKDLTEAAVLSIVFLVMGLIGGMLYSAVQGADMGAALLTGGLYGCYVSLVIAQINLIAAGFKESVGWGLIILFVPFGVVVFAVRFWEAARKPVFQALVSCVLAVIFGVTALTILVSSAPPIAQ